MYCVTAKTKLCASFCLALNLFLCLSRDQLRSVVAEGNITLKEFEELLKHVRDLNVSCTVNHRTERGNLWRDSVVENLSSTLCQTRSIVIDD